MKSRGAARERECGEVWDWSGGRVEPGRVEEREGGKVA
jgi:hypothetical protein